MLVIPPLLLFSNVVKGMGLCRVLCKSVQCLWTTQM